MLFRSEAGSTTRETLQKDPRPIVEDCILPVKQSNVRYIRITAVNPGPVPAWHLRAGTPTVLLTDEIIVE